MRLALDVIPLLARWENTLNCWEWPADMPFKPRDWDELPCFSRDKSLRTRYTVSSLPMRLLGSIIGKKESLRWHHLNNLGRTEDQFERWWKVRPYS